MNAALLSDFISARARHATVVAGELRAALDELGSRDAGHGEAWRAWQVAEANRRRAVAAYHAHLVELADELDPTALDLRAAA